MDKREVRVSRVGLGPLALFEGLLAAVLGFTVSVLAWISTTTSWTASTQTTLRGLLFGLAPGLGAVILDTIIYFVVGLIIGYVHGALFNLVASWMGGAEVATRDYGEDEEVARTAPARMRRAEPTFGETVDNRRRMDR
ncbi:MAG TPA: hypothetical protein VGH44_02885 [Candidatus Saccharimonadia bacterium]